MKNGSTKRPEIHCPGINVIEKWFSEHVKNLSCSNYWALYHILVFRLCHTLPFLSKYNHSKSCVLTKHFKKCFYNTTFNFFLKVNYLHSNVLVSGKHECWKILKRRVGVSLENWNSQHCKGLSFQKTWVIFTHYPGTLMGETFKKQDILCPLCVLKISLLFSVRYIYFYTI